ncbi:hypothetical protein [Fluviicola taffensis]|uniref:Lipoprotein n=1 Tax=Fluviicola taffensis (strain DSM 16823 / NCIMB 13979 / RW262) TaxID=755732 RepID=F2IAT0_FLUTR|nr:hypothetical protein [Fluviicola taffensis]AEA44235.1 hypothetical protein Fluta_2249 [Fluviicola taffensis DSM 16823]
MKKLIYLSLVTISFIAVSCNKNQEVSKRENESVVNFEQTYSEKDVTSIIQSINSSEKVGPGWFEKVKKWFNDHSGTHLFQGCAGGGACGPCPGLCIGGATISGNNNNGDSATPETYADGLRVYGLSLIENKETHEQAMMFVFNLDLADFTKDGYFYIENDISASSNMSSAMGKNNIKFIKGKYIVVFDETTHYYYALVETVMN